jgi:hypothetical protein
MVSTSISSLRSLCRRTNLAVMLGVLALPVALALPVLTQGTAAFADSSGCYMNVSPTAGRVGTQVTISGSTATCSISGGSLIFQDQHAAVGIPSSDPLLPTHGPFSYVFTIPVSMPSGTPAAAAQGYDGGGPVAPGPADFAVFMGSPGAIVTFDVTAAPVGWADYVSIAGTGSACNGCYGTGYNIFRSDGYLSTFAAPNAPGNVGTVDLSVPITGAAFTPDDAGYWMLGGDGGLFSFGDAPYEGSLPGDGVPVRDIVGMAATPDGKGYWLVGSDGGVFSFGDAGFLGSMGGKHLNAPVTGTAATPDGKGYWLVGSDGGVFSFGDARFLGSAAGGSRAFPMVGIAATPDGKGYWLLGQDGGVFTYGDAPFNGSGRDATLT